MACWHLVPIALFLLTLGCFVVSYIWSEQDGDIETAPFLSATINFPPVSCFGSFFLSIISIGLLCVGLLKWKLSADAWGTSAVATCCSSMLLQFSLVCVAVCTVSLIGIGAFQYHTLLYVHLLFAVTFFVFINVYFAVNLVIDSSILSYRHVSRGIWRTRVFLLIVSIACLVGTIGFLTRDSRDFRYLSATCEAAMCLTFLFHALSYVHELRHLQVTCSVRSFKDAKEVQPSGSSGCSGSVEGLPLLQAQE